MKTLTSIRCPMRSNSRQCEGLLYYKGNEETCIGTLNGCDLNMKSEMFECSLCESNFMRQWKWEVIKKDRA